jgi:hypothetical protein
MFSIGFWHSKWKYVILECLNISPTFLFGLYLNRTFKFFYNWFELFIVTFINWKPKHTYPAFIVYHLRTFILLSFYCRTKDIGQWLLWIFERLKLDCIFKSLFKMNFFSPQMKNVLKKFNQIFIYVNFACFLFKISKLRSP